MIELKRIAYTKCPECGAVCSQVGFETEYSSGQINQHINGDRWEYVVFTCGRKDVFSPNFCRIEMKSPCRHSPREQEKRQRRVDACKSVSIFIENLCVDDEYREFLLRSVREI